MPKIYKTDNKRLQEFQFSIKINSKENNEFRYIRNKVSNELYNEKIQTYKGLEKDNIPYLLIKSKFEKHFEFLGMEKAYFCNYTEYEGSFIIEFTILILETAVGYGGIRGTIDYFADDLESLFKRNLSLEFKTKVKYKTRKDLILEDQSNIQNDVINDIQRINNKVFINRILLGFSLFLIILISTYIINQGLSNEVVKQGNSELMEKNIPLNNAKIEVTILKKENDSVK